MDDDRQYGIKVCKMTVNGEWEGAWEEVVFANFKILSWHAWRKTGKP